MPSLDIKYGADFDFPARSEAPTLRYMIATTPRSGSTFFGALMWGTGRLGAPLEYLNPVFMDPLKARLGATDLVDYWARLERVRSSPNGVFGHKLFIPYWVWAAREKPEILAALRPDRVIHLTREDKVAQAVSLARARQTEAWASWAAERRRPRYDPALISGALEQVAAHERSWSAAFELMGATPLVLTYESIVEDQAAALDTVFRHFDLEPGAAAAPAVPPLERQSDALSSAWIRRFRATAAP